MSESELTPVADSLGDVRYLPVDGYPLQAEVFHLAVLVVDGSEDL